MERDAQLAARWLLDAASAGFAPAQHNLALLHLRGDGVTRDAAQAARWMREAALRGHAPAQRKLGQMHELGQGVARSEVEAQAWYTLARDEDARARELASALSARLSADQSKRAAALAERLRGEGEPQHDVLSSVHVARPR
jgi:TPR repeat protein